MIRIVCPYCHAPLGVNELEMASIDDHACLVCPECDHLLVTEEHAGEQSLTVQHQAHVDA